MQTELLVILRWVRTVGNVIYIVGALAVAWQVVKGVLFPDAPQLVSPLVEQAGK